MYKPDFIKYFTRKKRSRSSYIAKVLGGILFSLAISNAAFMVVSAHELEAYDNNTVAYVLTVSGDNYDGDDDIEPDDPVEPDPTDEIIEEDEAEEEIEEEEIIEEAEEEIIVGAEVNEYEVALAAFDTAHELYSGALANYQGLVDAGAADFELEAAYEELEQSYFALIKAHINVQTAQGDFNFEGDIEAELEAYRNVIRDYRNAQALYVTAAAEYETAMAEYQQELADYTHDLTEYANRLAAFREARAASPDGAAELTAPENPNLVRPVKPEAPALPAPDRPVTPGIFSIDGVQLP